VAIGLGIFQNAVEGFRRVLCCHTEMHDVLLLGRV
jgi:hypothetical protein